MRLVKVTVVLKAEESAAFEVLRIFTSVSVSRWGLCAIAFHGCIPLSLRNRCRNFWSRWGN